MLTEKDQHSGTVPESTTAGVSAAECASSAAHDNKDPGVEDASQPDERDGTLLDGIIWRRDRIGWWFLRPA